MKNQMSNWVRTNDSVTRLCTGDVVLNKLRDEVYVVSPTRKAIGCLLHAGACTFNDHAAIAAEDMLELHAYQMRNQDGLDSTNIRVAPDSRLAHGANEVGTGK